MPIKIEIIDPQDMPWEAVHKTAIYLLGMIGEKMPNNPVVNVNAPREENFAGPAVPMPTPISISNPVPMPSIEESKEASVPLPPSIEVDSENMPWDSRIHAKTKTKDKDGRWKKRKDVSKAFAQEVTEEVSSAMAVPTPDLSDVAPEHIEETFHSLMLKITDAINKGKVSHEQVINIVQSEGLQSVILLSTRMDLVPVIAARLKALMGE